MKEKYTAIVVGGGIAGLTSAAFIAQKGEKVLLIEKNAECGGLVNSFNHNGFHFDAGVRALEDAGVIFPMLKDLSIELEVVKSPVSVGIEKEILHIEGSESLVAYQGMLEKLFPGSVKDIAKVMKAIRKVMKHMDVLYGIENPLFKDINKDRAFLFKKLLPWLPRFIFTIGKINRMRMPVEEFLSGIIKDLSLKDVISQHFFKGTPSFFALSYFSLYLDYFYPKGGVGKLAEAMQQKVRELGGKISTETSIVKVQPDQNLLTDQAGNIYQYDQLIWAADLKTLYRFIPDENLPAEIKTSFQQNKNKLLSHKGGESVFSIFLKVDTDPLSLKEIAHGHFFYTPSKEGLGDIHRGELKHLLDNWRQIKKENIMDWVDRFTRYNTYEISIPCLKDSNLAPPQKSGLIISFLASYDLFVKIQDDGWYEEFKLLLEEKVVGVISDTVFPMLRKKIISKFSFSPISIEKRVGSSEGAITGWSFEEPVPVVHKIQLSDRSVFSPIPNIFQAGQWVYSPAGVPMSILTGKIAADKVIKQIIKAK